MDCFILIGPPELLILIDEAYDSQHDNVRTP